MAGESAVFTAATAFSVRMIMDDVWLMRSQSPMHGPCQEGNFIKQWVGGFTILSEIRHWGGRLTAAPDLHVDVAFSDS
ncbi:hypothetical protein [Mesorhizobium sp. M0488]|uniref:hypothetical protein n=1 Tax=unclassified Mesorhizobium TaxID=325217 RepID=UPI003339DBEF